MPDTDADLRDRLREVDALGITVSDWEADFLESVLAHDRPLTAKQRAVAEQILTRYLPL